MNGPLHYHTQKQRKINFKLTTSACAMYLAYHFLIQLWQSSNMRAILYCPVVIEA